MTAETSQVSNNSSTILGKYMSDTRTSQGNSMVTYKEERNLVKEYVDLSAKTMKLLILQKAMEESPTRPKDLPFSYPTNIIVIINCFTRLLCRRMFIPSYRFATLAARVICCRSLLRYY